MVVSATAAMTGPITSLLIEILFHKSYIQGLRSTVLSAAV